jgi:hypothetical protein
VNWLPEEVLSLRWAAVRRALPLRRRLVFANTEFADFVQRLHHEK